MSNYYLSEVLNSHSQASLSWLVACSEFVIYVLVSSLSFHRDRTSEIGVPNMQIQDIGDSRIFVSLPTKNHSAITQVVVPQVLKDCRFDLVRSYVAFHRSLL